MTTNALAKIEPSKEMFNKEQIAVIKKQFLPPHTSDAEMAYCFQVARSLGLNPITKEIFFVPRKQKNEKGQWVERIEPLVGRDGLLAIAHRSGVLAGMETTVLVRDSPTYVNGTWSSKPDLVATCSVWVKNSDRPFVVSVSYSEYVQLTSDGQPTKFWKDKKITMLGKVAESQALRRATATSGVYCPEECQAGMISDDGDLIIEADTITKEPSKPEPEKPRLTVVSSPPPQPQPPPAGREEDSWPEPSPPSDQSATAQSNDPVADIVTMLEARNIPHEIDMESGFITARSYNHKELLKSQGFKWSPEGKIWRYNIDKSPD